MKCSIKCRYYDAYVSGDGVKVVCLIRGNEIKHIPKEIRDDCDNGKEVIKK